MSSAAGNVLEVTFPRVSAVKQRPPFRVEVRQYDYLHDMAVLDYRGTPGNRRDFRTGTPVTVTWGTRARMETFLGTVLATRQKVTNGEQTLRVICIAPSHRFKEAGTAAYQGVSLQQALTRFALANQFDVALGLQDTFAYDNVTWTSGESAWQFFVRQAKRQGFSLFAVRTTLFCYDPVEAALADGASVPELHYEYGTGGKQGDLTEFTPVRSDEGFGRLARHQQVLFGVDPRTAQFVGATSDGTILHSLSEIESSPRFQTIIRDVPVAGAADAAARVRGMTRSNRWIHKARAVSSGSARLRQGRGVLISGVDDENDGLWYTHGVTHVIEEQRSPGDWTYETHLELLRDSESQEPVAFSSYPVPRSTIYSPPLSGTVADDQGWSSPSPTILAALV